MAQRYPINKKRVNITVKVRLALRFLLLAVFLASVATAQNFRSSIRGRITDASQKPIAGAQLKLTKEDTNERRTVSSGPTGEYALLVLPPGSYRLEVEQSGFKKVVRTTRLEINQELRFDFVLEVGTLTDEILVEEPRAALRRDSAALGAVIDNLQVVGLPLDGRNFLEFSLL